MSEAELSFDLPGGGHALFTTRAHGNLSSVGGDDAEHGLQARERLREQLGVERLLRGYQVHGTTVQARVRRSAVAASDSEAQPEIEADGQATALRGLGAMVLTADCLPVALGRERRRGDGARRLARARGGCPRGGRARGPGARRRRRSGRGRSAPAPGLAATRSARRSTRHSAGRTGSRARPPGNIDLKAIARDRLLAAG